MCVCVLVCVRMFKRVCVSDDMNCTQGGYWPNLEFDFHHIRSVTHFIFVSCWYLHCFQNNRIICKLTKVNKSEINWTPWKRSLTTADFDFSPPPEVFILVCMYGYFFLSVGCLIDTDSWISTVYTHMDSAHTQTQTHASFKTESDR